jgi:hypothetical protein
MLPVAADREIPLVFHHPPVTADFVPLWSAADIEKHRGGTGSAELQPTRKSPVSSDSSMTVPEREATDKGKITKPLASCMMTGVTGGGSKGTAVATLAAGAGCCRGSVAGRGAPRFTIATTTSAPITLLAISSGSNQPRQRPVEDSVAQSKEESGGGGGACQGDVGGAATAAGTGGRLGCAAGGGLDGGSGMGAGSSESVSGADPPVAAARNASYSALENGLSRQSLAVANWFSSRWVCAARGPVW